MEYLAHIAKATAIASIWFAVAFVAHAAPAHFQDMLGVALGATAVVAFFF